MVEKASKTFQQTTKADGLSRDWRLNGSDSFLGVNILQVAHIYFEHHVPIVLNFHCLRLTTIHLSATNMKCNLESS